VDLQETQTTVVEATQAAMAAVNTLITMEIARHAQINSMLLVKLDHTTAQTNCQSAQMDRQETLAQTFALEAATTTVAQHP